MIFFIARSSCQKPHSRMRDPFPKNAKLNKPFKKLSPFDPCFCARYVPAQSNEVRSYAGSHKSASLGNESSIGPTEATIRPLSTYLPH